MPRRATSPGRYAKKSPVSAVAALGDVNRHTRLRAFTLYLPADHPLGFLEDVDARCRYPTGGALRGYRLTRRPSPREERALLDLLRAHERDGTLVIVGNGGAGGCGLFKVLANLPAMAGYLVVWHGGDSDENFEHAYAMHAALTYEPHMELAFLAREGGKTRTATPETVMVNHLVLVPGDARFRTFFRRLRFPSSSSAHTQLGYALVRWAYEHPRSFVYLSRYNHSAVGEHDRMLFVLGCRRYLPESNFDDFDSLLSHFVRTFVVRDQTRYPDDVSRMGDAAHAFYLNDAAFVEAPHALPEPRIANPGQLWFTPYYPRPPWAAHLARALRSDAVARFLHPHTTVVRTPTDRHVQDYLRRQHEVHRVAGESQLQDWTLLQFRHARYAHVECASGSAPRCRVNTRVGVGDVVQAHSARRLRRRSARKEKPSRRRA